MVLLLAPPAAADLAEGRRAYEAGLWPRAMELLLPLAERGDAEAQFLVGAIYNEGAKGIKRERETAVGWYRKAAERGNPAAQYELFVLATNRPGDPAGLRNDWAQRLAEQGRRLDGHARAQAAYCAEYLGLVFARGQGGAYDPAAAYAWFSLAVDLGRQEARPALEALAAEMSEAEIADGKGRAAKLLR